MKGMVFGNCFFDYETLSIYSLKNCMCLYGVTSQNQIKYESKILDEKVCLLTQIKDNTDKELKYKKTYIDYNHHMNEMIIFADDVSAFYCLETILSKKETSIRLMSNFLPHCKEQFYLSDFWNQGVPADDSIKYIKDEGFYKENFNLELHKADFKDFIVTPEYILNTKNSNKFKYLSFVAGIYKVPDYPKVPGIGLKNIYSAANSEDFLKIKKLLLDPSLRNITVVGRDLDTQKFINAVSLSQEAVKDVRLKKNITWLPIYNSSSSKKEFQEYYSSQLGKELSEGLIENVKKRGVKVIEDVKLQSLKGLKSDQKIKYAELNTDQKQGQLYATDLMIICNNLPNSKSIKNLARCNEVQEAVHINVLGKTSYPDIYGTGTGVSMSQFNIGRKEMVSSTIQLSQLGKSIALNFQHQYQGTCAIPHYSIELPNNTKARISGHIRDSDEIVKYGNISDDQFQWVYVKSNQIVGLVNKGYDREAGVIYYGILNNMFTSYNLIARKGWDMRALESQIKDLTRHQRDDYVNRVQKQVPVFLR